MVLSAQIAWSENVEAALSSIGGSGDSAPLQSVLSNVEVTLNVLADSVLMEQPPLRRRKLEHLVSPCPLSSPRAVTRRHARKAPALVSGRKHRRWLVTRRWASRIWLSVPVENQSERRVTHTALRSQALLPAECMPLAEFKEGGLVCCLFVFVAATGSLIALCE